MAPSSTPPGNSPADGPPALPGPRRPLLERLGLAGIAIVLAALFGTVGAVSFIGGEPFLGFMGLAGCLMTLWVGAITLLRG